MTNYIYTPDNNNPGFRCRVPLNNTVQLFVADGIMQQENIGEISIQQQERGYTLHVEKDSFLYSVYGDMINGNSYHVQCADVPAPGFRVTARAEDGTIEAIEKGNILGVQWHPESMRDMKFFHAYVERYLK